MSADFEPYLNPPREVVGAPRLVGTAGMMWVTIVLVILGAVAGLALLADRQDPTLSAPGGQTPPAADDAADDLVPLAPELPDLTTE